MDCLMLDVSCHCHRRSQSMQGHLAGLLCQSAHQLLVMSKQHIQQALGYRPVAHDTMILITPSLARDLIAGTQCCNAVQMVGVMLAVWHNHLRCATHPFFILGVCKYCILRGLTTVLPNLDERHCCSR